MIWEPRNSPRQAARRNVVSGDQRRLLLYGLGVACIVAALGLAIGRRLDKPPVFALTERDINRDHVPTGGLEAQPAAPAILREGLPSATKCPSPATSGATFQGALSGRVVDRQGQPVACATVRVCSFSSAPAAEPLWQITTALDGSFRIPDIRALRVRIEAYADGYAPSVRAPVELCNSMSTDIGDIVLHMPARLRVVVQGASTEPLACARVTVLLCPSTVIARGAALTGQTDASGTAEFVNIPPGLHEITADLAGYQSVHADIDLPAGSEVAEVLQLAPVGGVVPQDGRVVNCAGRPIGKAKVLVQPKEGGTQEAVTDEDGRFLVLAPERAESAPYRVTVDAGDRGVASLSLRSEGSPWLITLPQPVWVRGRVVEVRTNQPLSGVHVYTSFYFADPPRQFANAVTDATGIFSVTAYECGGSYTPMILMAAARGYQPYSREVEQNELAAEQLVVELEPYSCQLVGTVVDDAGLAISGATVEITNPEQLFADGLPAWTETSSDGSFVLPVSSRYFLEVAVNAPGYARRTIGWDTYLGEGNVNIGQVVLLRTTPCTLRVTEATGTPIAGAFFTPELVAGSSEDLVIPPTDGAGEATVQLPCRQLPAVVYRPGYAPMQVVLDGCRVGATLTFVLSRGSRIMATVTAEGGGRSFRYRIVPASLSRVQVGRAFVGHRQVLDPLNRTDRVGDRGHVQIDDVPVGSYTLVVSDSTGAAWSFPVNIPRAGDVVDLGVLSVDEHHRDSPERQ